MKRFIYTCRRCLCRVVSSVELAGAIYCSRCERKEAKAHAGH